MDFTLFFSFLFFEVLDLLSKMGECQVDKSILTQRTDGRQPGGSPAGGGVSGGRQSDGSGQLDSSFLIGREPMVSQKTRSGASSLDRQFEWFFKVKGVKKEMRSPLWVAMDTANLLIASDNVRMRALQDVSWKLINMYLANVEMAAGAEEGRFRDVCVQTATALRASSLNNGVVELVVATIMHLREGTFDGLLETLHAAAGWYEGSKSRDRTGPWYSTWPTVNQFLPLTGRPIRGVIGIKYTQGPIERLAGFLVAGAIERAEERNLWTVGACDCCERNEASNRMISVPCAARSGFNQDNRLLMDFFTTGQNGRPVFFATPAMPSEAVQAICGGGGVAGTCLICGEIVLLGMDTEETSGNGRATEKVAPFVGDSSAGPAAAARGERRGRGWGRFGSARMRVRRRRQSLPCVCHPLRLSDDIFSCTCLHGHHPRGVDRTSADGYVDNTDELERGGGLSGDGLGGVDDNGGYRAFGSVGLRWVGLWGWWGDDCSDWVWRRWLWGGSGG